MLYNETFNSIEWIPALRLAEIAEFTAELSIPLNGFSEVVVRVRRATLEDTFNSIEWILTIVGWLSLSVEKCYLSIPLNGFYGRGGGGWGRRGLNAFQFR